MEQLSKISENSRQNKTIEMLTIYFLLNQLAILDHSMVIYKVWLLGLILIMYADNYRFSPLIVVTVFIPWKTQERMWCRCICNICRRHINAEQNKFYVINLILYVCSFNLYFWFAKNIRASIYTILHFTFR